jgi:hypothetical protein
MRRPNLVSRRRAVSPAGDAWRCGWIGVVRVTVNAAAGDAQIRRVEADSGFIRVQCKDVTHWVWNAGT